MKIIVRHADTDTDAFLIAQSMESVGASVFSVTYNGVRSPLGGVEPSSRFLVWAKYDEPLTTDAIDDSISKALYPASFGEDEREQPK